ncbi:hypothetical protein IWW36_006030, partial [Coemansia brasiliensis]
MNVGRVASVLHIICASFVLWIVPAQYVFFIDLVAFPVSLFLSLRDIITKYQLPSSSLRADAPAKGSSIEETSQTTARDYGSRAGVRQRTKEDNSQETVPPAKAEPAGMLARQLPAGKTMLLLVKVALFAMVIDFVYRPLLVPAEDLFVFRPGYVSHDRAKLHIRYTDGGNLEMRYRKINANSFEFADNMPWESAGEFGPPTNLTDFTTTTTLLNLQPATRYL